MDGDGFCLCMYVCMYVDIYWIASYFCDIRSRPDFFLCSNLYSLF